MLNNYMDSKTKKQIEDLTQLIGLPEYVIEKDFYVTQAIAIVTQISHELYDLVFQGGTSLSKAHRIIERMSEDCDFRVRFKEPEKISARNLNVKHYVTFVMN